MNGDALLRAAESLERHLTAKAAKEAAKATSAPVPAPVVHRRGERLWFKLKRQPTPRASKRRKS